MYSYINKELPSVLRQYFPQLDHSRYIVVVQCKKHSVEEQGDNLMNGHSEEDQEDNVVE